MTTDADYERLTDEELLVMATDYASSLARAASDELGRRVVRLRGVIDGFASDENVERIAQLVYEHTRDPEYSGEEWDWPNIDRSYDWDGYDDEPRGEQWLRDRFRDDVRFVLASAVPVVPDYTDDGEQDNAIDGLMRHVGMPRPHGKHYVVDERPDVTDDEAEPDLAQSYWLIRRVVELLASAPIKYDGLQSVIEIAHQAATLLNPDVPFPMPALPDVLGTS